MHKYDLIISLGNDYVPAMALKFLRITEKTYPFDWSNCNGDSSEKLLKKCTAIKNRFEDEFNIDNFIKYYDTKSFMRSLKNVKTGIYYAQDFTRRQSVKDFFPEFLEKYQRRIQRLYTDIENTDNILFLYQDTTSVPSSHVIKKAINILKASFPNKNINLFIFLPLVSTKTTKCYKMKTNVDNVCLFGCTKKWPENSEKRVALFANILKNAMNDDFCSFETSDDNACSCSADI